MTIPDLQWREQGACRDMDTGEFYSVSDDFPGYKPSARAYRACKNCPVNVRCFEWALRNEDYGFWAGTTEKERRASRKKAGITVKKWTFETRSPTWCGTVAGYKRHQQNNEEACQACLAANAQATHPNGRTHRITGYMVSL